jgi:hypothetical protein
VEEVEKDKPELLKSLKEEEAEVEEEVAYEGCCELSLQREKVLEVSDSDDG